MAVAPETVSTLTARFAEVAPELSEMTVAFALASSIVPLFRVSDGVLMVRTGALRV